MENCRKGQRMEARNIRGAHILLHISQHMVRMAHGILWDISNEHSVLRKRLRKEDNHACPDDRHPDSSVHR